MRIAFPKCAPVAQVRQVASSSIMQWSCFLSEAQRRVAVLRVCARVFSDFVAVFCSQSQCDKFAPFAVTVAMQGYAVAEKNAGLVLKRDTIYHETMGQAVACSVKGGSRMPPSMTQ